MLNGRRWTRVSCLPVLLALLLAAPVVAQSVTVYVSSTAGDRLTAKRAIRFGAGGAAGEAAFRIDDAIRHQRMIGFGASFLEAGMICLNSLPRGQQEAVLRALFDPRRGAGFSAMKTVIGATDFMSAGPFYTLDDTPGDVELKHFSIARDRGPNGLIPYIKRARRYGTFILQAPMDYPPDWMLIDVEKNQDVDPRYYDALAHYYLKYAQAYEKAGITVDYVSLFNEPGIYTKITWEEIRDLLKNHVGPLFEKSGIKTRLQPSESANRAIGATNYHIILDDPDARKYVSNLPYHGYDFMRLDKKPTRENGYKGEEFAGIAALHRKYPDLLLWMTEVCYFTGNMPWAKPIPRYDFEDGDFWGNQIASDIEAGSSGYTYWNMILDERGGPWLVSKIHEDPDDNVQHPLVIVNRTTHEVSYTGAYWYLAHFSKFVRPGSVRLDIQGGASGLRCLAFQRPNGQHVVELINSRKSEAPVSIEWQHKTLRHTLPAQSITTLEWGRGQ